MVAKNTYDKGLSVLDCSQFNYDGTIHDSISIDEARQVFDYEVAKEQSCRPDGTPVPKQFHLIRKDVNELLDTAGGVGDEFDVSSQPLDAFNFITQEIMPRMPGLRIETAATMYNGATCFLNLAYKDGFSLPNDESKHFTNILYCNPLSRGRITVVSHAVRVVCMNTLANAMKKGEGFRIAHTRNGQHLVEVALETMQNEILALEERHQQMEFLANKEISSAQVKALLEKIVPLEADTKGKSLTIANRTRDEITKQFETDDSFTKKTFWSFFSANSFLSEHPLHKKSTTDNAQIAFENIVGARANRKNEIFDAVFEMAKAA